MSSARHTEESRKELASRLEARLRRLEDRPEVSAETLAYRRAAAVLGPFEPARLQPLASEGVESHSKRLSPAVRLLVSDCAEMEDGRWMLQLALRREALAELLAEGRVDEAMAANPEEASGGHSQLLRRMLQGWIPDLAEFLSLGKLRELDEVLTWVQGLTKLSLPEDLLPKVRRAIEMRRLTEPFHALVGEHFQGRQRQLEQMRDHVGVYDPSTWTAAIARSALKAVGSVRRPPLLIHGPGGIGKSSLIARFILDHAEATQLPPIPYAYLDFDDPGHDPLTPASLLLSIGEQLERQIPELELERTLANWREEVLRARRYGDEGDSTESLEDQVHRVVEWLESYAAEGWESEQPPFLLVLDTFEEAQVLGVAAERQVDRLLRAMQRAIPRLRTVISGRARPRHIKGQDLRLAELDRRAGLSLLAARGVQDSQLQEEIFERIGGSPLSLTLAAEAVGLAGGDTEVIQDVRRRAFLLFKVDEAQVQGQLYDRILKHIHDLELRQLAHPGLILRRLTVPVLQQVLAEPCGFDPASAEDLLGRLQREVSLVRPAEEGVLVHRQDVRRVMLRNMLRVPEDRERIRDIQQRAVRFYAEETGLENRSEELYHRLMLGESPRQLDALWDPAMDSSLRPAWEEPLPASSRAWLAARLGIYDESVDWSAAEQADWEMHTASEARNLLEANDPKAALDQLQQRKERSDSSSLFLLEARALADLGKDRKADEVAEEGLQRNLQAGNVRNALDLYTWAAHRALQRQDLQTLEQLVADGQELAQTLERHDRILELGRLLLQGRRSMAPEDEQGAQAAQSKLVDAFLLAPEETLEKDRRQTADLVATLGEANESVLGRAVQVIRPSKLQDQSSQTLQVILEDAAKHRIFGQRKEELAREVGIQDLKVQWNQIADQAIKHGKVADLLKTVVKDAGHDRNVRGRVADLLSGGARSGMLGKGGGFDS